MSEKRKRGRDETSTHPRKKQHKGFTVGPQNLPDGTYKRKTQKIKKSLIERASIKSNYAKLKRQGIIPDQHEGLPVPASSLVGPDAALPEDLESETGAEPTTAPHPDRQTLIDGPNTTDAPIIEEQRPQRRERRQRKPRPIPFQREQQEAQQRKAEAEARRQAREEAAAERQRKVEERERFRKAMAKARRGGVNGQRKLGRESTVLLERVRRMVGDGRV